ncbi:MAG TPA: hypothetical protein VGE62_00265 [Candidatus Paceibacterota bacterium]
MKKSNSNIAFALVASGILALPELASAQVIQNFGDFIKAILGLVQMLIPLVVALTLLVFMWGVFQLVRSSSEDARKEGIAIITYGIVSLFVMVSVWGLVQILTSTFFGGALIYPQLKSSLIQIFHA